VALVLVGLSYYFRLEIIVSAFPSENESLYLTLLGLLFIFLGFSVLIWALYNYFHFQLMLAERWMTIKHEAIHFSVAAFVGFKIFTACIFNIMHEAS